MPDILQDLWISAPTDAVYAAVSNPDLLAEWWTLGTRGTPSVGAPYELDFGPEHQWAAVVTRAEADRSFQLRMTTADADWTGTTVGFDLEPADGGTRVRFQHLGWPKANDHFRTTSHCWALYLRVMRRHIEHGERVPYADRLSV